MSIVVRVRAMDYAKQYENDWNNFEVKTSKFLIRPYRDDFALSLSLSMLTLQFLCVFKSTVSQRKVN